MEIVSICQEMGWTYFEYIEQPSWFLELLKTKLQIDSERIEKEIKNSRFHLRQ